MIIRFLLYGFAGWSLEIFWTSFGSLLKGDYRLEGHTYLWMFPIYGTLICLEPIHEILRPFPILIRGGVYTILIFTGEYLSGWLIKQLIGSCPWDYSDASPLSIRGLIRLDYAPAWFIVGLLFERFHDFLLVLTSL